MAETAEQIEHQGDGPEYIEAGSAAAVSKSIGTVREAAREIPNYPQSWEDCYVNPDEEPRERMIDMEKARAFLYARRKKQIYSTELALAIAEKPGEEPPYSAGVFTPLSQDPYGKLDNVRRLARTEPGDDKTLQASVEQAKAQLQKVRNDRVIVNRNITLILEYDLEEAGFKDDAIKPGQKKRLIQSLKARYIRNLEKLRTVHNEVTFFGHEFTPKQILDNCHEVMTADPKEDELYITASAAFDAVNDVHSSGSFMAISSSSSRQMPTRLISHLPENYFTEESRDRTIRMIMFLDKLGLIKLNADEHMEDDFVGTDGSDGVTRRILTTFSLFQKAMQEAMGFLHTGDHLYQEMQRNLLGHSLDEGDRLQDLRHLTFPELLDYAITPTHPNEWRNQAMLLAVTTMKHMELWVHPHYIAATAVAEKLTKAYSGIDYVRKATGEYETVSYPYFKDKDGNATMRRSKRFPMGAMKRFRVYKAKNGSGRLYTVNISDKPTIVKDPRSIVIKGLLKNSKGRIEVLNDVARQESEVGNIDSLGDEEVQRDLMLLLIEGGNKMGHKLAIKQPFDIRTESVIDIIKNKLKKREDLLPGEFTIEIKLANSHKISGEGAEGPNTRSYSEVEFIKAVGRSPDGTGWEKQLKTSRNRQNTSSKIHPAGHRWYTYGKTLDLMPITYSPSYFPITWFIVKQLHFKKQAYSLRFRADNILTKIYEAHNSGLTDQVEELNKQYSQLMKEATKLDTKAAKIQKIIDQLRSERNSDETDHEDPETTLERIAARLSDEQDNTAAAVQGVAPEALV